MVTDAEFVLRLGGHAPQRTVSKGVLFKVFAEDTFSGRLTTRSGRPCEVAPFPRVNPLAGPIEVEGAKTGEILAVRLVDLVPARDWGVATVSPDFGLLSGTRANPNLQPEQEERVWIWQFADNGRSLVTETSSGNRMKADFKPFLGTIDVAPAHGEIRLSVTPGDFGGNLDLPFLGPGATIYLQSNVDGGHLYLGDGHYVQGDGEIAGTAVEGALCSTLVAGRLPPDQGFDWPRIETDSLIGVIGCARPLEDAVRIAASGLVRWIAELTGYDTTDLHEFVSQTCRLRIGNLVNPAFSVCCSVKKNFIRAKSPVMGDMHRLLSEVRKRRVQDAVTRRLPRADRTELKIDTSGSAKPVRAGRTQGSHGDLRTARHLIQRLGWSSARRYVRVLATANRKSARQRPIPPSAGKGCAILPSTSYVPVSGN